MSFHRLVTLGVILSFILITAPLLSVAAAINFQPVERVSGEAGGSYAAISGDGRYVVYESVGDSPAGYWNVFLFDRQAGRTELISQGKNGGPASNVGDYSSPPAISSDGRYVVYMSMAGDIVTLPTGGLPNIYLRDRQTGTSALISVAPGGKAANGPSWNPAVSANGRFVAFQSHATNLAPGDNNDSVDIFVRDRQLGVTELVSVTDGGEQGLDFNDYGFSSLSISGDGRYVAFSYQHLPVGSQPDTGEAGIYLRDRQAGATRRIAGGSFPTLSAGGRYLVFVSSDPLVAADKNGEQDVYLYDLQARTYERISVGSGGEARGQFFFCAAAISADGRYVAFETTAALLPEDRNDLSDVYLRDRQTGELRLVTSAADGRAAAGESHYPALSADGSVVAFTSNAANLGPSGQKGHVYARSISAAALVPGDQRIYIPLVIR